MTTADARVERHLESQGIAYTLRRHRDFPDEIRTPADFADALGYHQGRVTKSVLCRAHSAAFYAVLVVPSDSRVDFTRASRALGAGRLEVASPEELGQLTGYPRFGLSPLGLNPTITVMVARDLLDYESVLVGSGTVSVEIELSPGDLVDATRAVVDSIALPGR